MTHALSTEQSIWDAFLFATPVISCSATPRRQSNKPPWARHLHPMFFYKPPIRLSAADTL